MSQPLEQFRGRIVRRGDEDYEVHRYQYAFSSHAADGHMAPAAVLYPTSTRDVMLALEHAARHSLAVAVRTGGHHHAGASSTSGENLLLDLRDTYPEFAWDPARDRVRAGVSLALDRFNAKLGALGLFVPHGQCSHVRLGGHVQTGGWGMLARSYGLFSDYVESLELITADRRSRVVHRDSADASERDLFFALLGGTPGSFGVVTHVTFRPLHDRDHPNARGLKFLMPYSRARLQALLDVMVEMSSDTEFDREFDFSVTVLGAAQLHLPFARSEGIDEQMRVRHPEVYGRNELSALPAGISVYAQWGNTLGAGQRFDPSFFRRIKAAAGYGSTARASEASPLLRLAHRLHPRALLEAMENRARLGPVPIGLSSDAPTAMSTLTRSWVFPNVREFNLPYIKRCYLSNSTSLGRTGWSEWVTRRFDALVSPNNGCRGFLQVQHVGGARSRFRENSLDGATAHSWRRDTTLCCLMDCFYDEHGDHPTPPRQRALAWQRENDLGALEQRIFSDEDRRVLWGPWGDRDITAVWPRYFDTREKYERLRAIKRRVDPTGLFTAGPFGIRPDDAAPGEPADPAVG